MPLHIKTTKKNNTIRHGLYNDNGKFIAGIEFEGKSKTIYSVNAEIFSEENQRMILRILMREYHRNGDPIHALKKVAPICEKFMFL